MIRLNVEKRIDAKEVERILRDENLSKSRRMIELFKGGLEVKEISKMLEVRYNFVYNVINNYLIKEGLIDSVIKEKKSSKKDEIIKYWLEGYSVISIAKELRLNYNYVWKICRESMENEELRKEFEKKRKNK